MTARRVFLLLGAMALVVQCLGLYGPPGPPSAPGIPFDKINHVVGFAVPVTLFLLARVDWKVVAVLALLQGVVSEVVQGLLLADRMGDPLDLLADVVGIALGGGIAWILRRSLGRRPRARDRHG